MKKNLGTADRLLRMALALGIAILIASGRPDGLPALLLGAVAAVLALTSTISFCPLYAPLGLSTRRQG